MIAFLSVTTAFNRDFKTKPRKRANNSVDFAAAAAVVVSIDLSAN